MLNSWLRRSMHGLLPACLLLAAGAVQGAAQGVYVGAGSSLYGSDEFCLSTSAALSGIRVGVGGDALGASVSYNNEDWPWPRPPGSGGGGAALVPDFAASLGAAAQEDFYLTRGEAFQAVFEVFPLGLSASLRESTARVRRYLTPFAGIGVLIAGDGDPAPASADRTLPTYAVQGGTEFLVAYGATLRVPAGSDNVRLMLQFRGTSVFARGIQLTGPAGDVIDAGNQTLTWGEWLVGLSFGT